MESLVVADIAELKDNQVRWRTAPGGSFVYIRSQSLNTTPTLFKFFAGLEQTKSLFYLLYTAQLLKNILNLYLVFPYSSFSYSIC